MNSSKAPVSEKAPFSLEAVRAGFPFFSGERFPKHFLDTAASSLRAAASVERMRDFSSFEYANVHRGAYSLSQHATQCFEAARETVRTFLSAKKPAEIIFTSGATHSMNLLAHALEAELLRSSRPVLSTVLEHHSNLVPWQLLRDRRGIGLELCAASDTFSLDMGSLERKLEEHSPRLVTLSPQSNAFGALLDLPLIAELCRKHDALLHLDLCQYLVHHRVDVSELPVDFLSFSSHKLYGPNSLGVFYARESTWELLEPFLAGGEMVGRVTEQGASWAAMPHKFEAGTPPVAEAVAFAAALKYLMSLREQYDLSAREEELYQYSAEKLRAVEGLECYLPEQGGAIVAFNLQGVHPHDVATIVDQAGVAVRAGQHCAEPALSRYDLQATVRMSLGVYSSHEDVDALVGGLKDAKKIFG